MLNIAVIGIGFMGKTHLENYLRLEREGAPIRVVALCDIDETKMNGGGAAGNIDTVKEAVDYGRFNKYTSIGEMLEREKLDIVDITLPTYLHREMAVACLERGIHVLCEKPMALTVGDCDAMIEAAKANGKSLMIGQCLRFWPAYVYLKELIDGGTFGKPLSGSFFRGGGTPGWGPWVLEKDKGGGALMDMHVHDTDMVNWLYGKPEAVSCMGKNVIPGSGFDIVSTNYRYADGKVIHGHVDWTQNGDFGFEMGFKANFEKGNVQFIGGKLKVNPNEGQGYYAELPDDDGYYFEVKHFVESILNDKPITIAEPESTKGSIQIIEAEVASADAGGEWVKVL